MSGSNRRKPVPAASGAAGEAAAAGKARASWVAGIVGVCFALILNKLGAPVVIPPMFDPPAGLWDALLLPWPMSWGLMLLGAAAITGLLVASPEPGRPMWLFWMPAAWLGWQFVAHTQSIDPALSARTLTHFTAVVASFYLGWLVVGRLRHPEFFFGTLVLGFLFVLLSGFQQRYGELEQTMRYVEEHEQQGWRGLPPEELERFASQGVLVQTNGVWTASPEFLKRLGKGRVFGTFAGYPNALASAVILLLPVAVTWLWQATGRFPLLWRRVLVGVMTYMALACLYWTGSKSGWLIFLAMLSLVCWHLPWLKRWRNTVLTVVIGVGLITFSVKFSDYFRKGATSVGARIACWKVAVENGLQNPIFGTGPGTFGRVYQVKKTPDAEMAKLAHNDYLEQWTDSGFIGFVAYLSLTIGAFLWLYRKSDCLSYSMTSAALLGFLGWLMQGVVEFTLYIPALSWTAFLLLGWMLGRSRQLE